MNYKIRPLETFAVGFFVLLVWMVVLFWGEFVLKIAAANISSSSGIQLYPEGLLQPSLENDPNIRPPYFDCRAGRGDAIFYSLGIVSSFASFPFGEDAVFLWSRDNVSIYYDRSIGNLVYCKYMKVKKWYEQEIYFYVGPEGISKTPNESIGRFVEPVFSEIFTDCRGLFVYDKALRRFFRVEANWARVYPEKGGAPSMDLARYFYAGPVIEPNLPFMPVQIGSQRIVKGFGGGISYYGPSRKGNQSGHVQLVQIQSDIGTAAGQYLLVLDKSGGIMGVDRQTLTYSKFLGRLPSVLSFFGRVDNPAPYETPAYEIVPISMVKDGRSEYQGLCATVMAKDGLDVSAVFYDKDGKISASSSTSSGYWSRQSVTLGGPSDSTYMLTERPGGPLVLTIKYFFENLYPPAMSVASFFASDLLKAPAGGRSIFIKPDSFAGMLADTARQYPFSAFWQMWLFIIPSVIVSFALGLTAMRSAGALGYSKQSSRVWFGIVLLFGIPGFITYKLCRPKEVMITCLFCGKGRQTVLDRCQNCGKGWDTSAIKAPDWRVIDSPGDTTETGEKTAEKI